jgi:hypothetical protein
MATPGRMSENTCNDLLTNELRNRSLEAFFERHFTTLEGIKKPDIFITCDGYYFIEGKQRPSQLIHAVEKAYKYSRSIHSTVSPKAVFGVLYPENCMGQCEAAVLLDRSPYYIEHKTTSLHELSNWIYEFVTTPAIPTEINTNHAIRLLNQAVSTLNLALTKLDIKEVEEIFGGKLFFETVLGYEEEDKVPTQNLRMAAAYLLVNQILFYQVLSRETKDYDTLDSEKLKHPTQLQNMFFAKVLMKDYKPIFDFDVSSRLKGSTAVDAIKTTINAINALSPEKHPHDILGKIFHNLIPFEIRKSVAAYFTNSEAAELLATLAVEGPELKVMDPAVGSGTLLMAAYHRKKELIKRVKKREFLESDHKRFIEKQITGVDIMPFAAHLAAVHLALQAPLYYTDNVRIAIHDSTNLKPGKYIQAAQETLKEAYKTQRISDYFSEISEVDSIRRKTVRGRVTLSDLQAKPMELETAHVIVMNPPFTRQERVPEHYKDLLTKRFYNYRKYLHGQLGLYGYFILLADMFLEKDGKLALILPATILRLKSTKDIRELLVDHYHVKYIITTSQKSAFSESAEFREILFVAQKLTDNKEAISSDYDLANLKTAIIELKRLPHNSEEAKTLAEKIKDLYQRAPTDKTYQDDSLIVQVVSQDVLRLEIDNLYVLLSVNLRNIWNHIMLKASDGMLTSIDNAFNDNIVENIQRFDYKFDGTFIHHDRARAKKNKDIWIVKEVKNNIITSYNRFVDSLTVNVPLKATEFGFRRTAGTGILDITHLLDFIVVDSFSDFQIMFPDQTKRKILMQNFHGWRSYAKAS